MIINFVHFPYFHLLFVRASQCVSASLQTGYSCDRSFSTQKANAGHCGTLNCFLIIVKIIINNAWRATISMPKFVRQWWLVKLVELC